MKALKQLITIDWGNSHPNMALFHEGKLLRWISPEEVLPFMGSWTSRYNTYDWVISSVRKNFPWRNELYPYLQKSSQLRTQKSYGDMPVHYSQTLGEDRLVQAYYLYKQVVPHTSSNKVLLIDAGTFTTVDLISDRGFEGGHILPGLKTTLQTYKRGEKLPELDVSNLNFNLDLEGTTLPHSTSEAIGQSVVLQLATFFQNFSNRHTGIKAVYLTGGEAYLIEKILRQLKENTPKCYNSLHIEPQLIHYALNDLSSLLLPTRRERGVYV